MKRNALVFITVLALFLAFSLVGCGGASSSAPKPASSEAQSAAEEASDAPSSIAETQSEPVSGSEPETALDFDGTVDASGYTLYYKVYTQADIEAMDTEHPMGPKEGDFDPAVEKPLVVEFVKAEKGGEEIKTGDIVRQIPASHFDIAVDGTSYHTPSIHSIIAANYQAVYIYVLIPLDTPDEAAVSVTYS